MARIQTYQSQVGGTITPGVQVPQGAFGGGIAQGLGGIAQGLGTAADVAIQQQRQDDALSVYTLAAQRDADIDVAIGNLRRSAAADGAGLSESAQAEIERINKDYRSRAPNETVGRALDIQFTQKSARELEGVRNYQAGLSDQSKLSAMDQATDLRANRLLVAPDPAAYQAAISDYERVIAEAGLSAQAREKALIVGRDKINKSYLWGTIDRDPQDFINRAEAGEFEKFDATTLSQAMSHAQVELRRRENEEKAARNEARAGIMADLADNPVKAFNGVAVPPLTAEQIAALKPHEISRYQAEIEANALLGDISRRASMLSPEEMAQALDKARPDPNKPGYAIYSQAYDKAMALFSRAMEAREKDPAGSIAASSAVIKDLWNSDSKAAIERTRALLNSFGMPNRSAVPDAIVANFVGQITSAKSGDEIAALMTDTAKMVGPGEWPSVIKRATAMGKFPPAFAALPMLNTELMGPLAKAILEDGENEKAIQARFGGEQKRLMDQQAGLNDSGLTAKFVGALSMLSGGSIDRTMRSGITAAVHSYAKHLMLNGFPTPSDAYKQAEKVLIDDVYHVETGNGALIFPKSPGVDSDDVAAFIRAELAPDKIRKIENQKPQFAVPRDVLNNAMIQIESSGNPRSVSSAGALGLMQLMPDTAREVAGKLGIPPPTNEQLLSDPELNKRLGSEYLRQQLAKYGADSEISLRMAAAAYNGGPGAVSSAIEKAGDPRKTGDWATFAKALPKESANHADKFISQITRLTGKPIQGFVPQGEFTLKAPGGGPAIDVTTGRSLIPSGEFDYNATNLITLSTPDGTKAFAAYRKPDGMWAPVTDASGKRVEVDIAEAKRRVSEAAKAAAVVRHEVAPRASAIEESTPDINLMRAGL